MPTTVTPATVPPKHPVNPAMSAHIARRSM
jgi:hypothetical protein